MSGWHEQVDWWIIQYGGNDQLISCDESWLTFESTDA